MNFDGVSSGLAQAIHPSYRKFQIRRKTMGRGQDPTRTYERPTTLPITLSVEQSHDKAT